MKKEEYMYLSGFSSGYAAVMKDGYCGVIDEAGEIIIPLEYHYVFMSYPCEGHFIVKKWRKWGVVNIKNEIVVPLEYDYISCAGSKPSLKVRLNGKYGLLDVKKNVIFPVVYGELRHLSYNSDLWIQKSGDKYALTYEDGRTTGAIYDYIPPSTDPSWPIKVQLNGKWGVIDADFKVIVPAEYERVWILDHYIVLKSGSDWYYSYYIDGKNLSGLERFDKLEISDSAGVVKTINAQLGVCSFIVEEGELYLSIPGVPDPSRECFPMDIDDTGYCNKAGLAYVLKDGKYGLRNELGEIIVPCLYDNISIVNDKYVKVGIDGKYGLLDREGERIAEPIYDDVDGYEDVVYVTSKGKMGCWGIGERAEINIPCSQFDELAYFVVPDRVVAKVGNKYGLIDSTGNIILPFVYDRFFMSDEENAIGYEKDGEVGVYHYE